MPCASAPTRPSALAGLVLIALLLTCTATPGLAQIALEPTQTLEEWQIEVGVPDGILQLSGQQHGFYYRAYHCPSFDIAQSIVAMLAEADAGARPIAMDVAMEEQNCRPAKGEYQVLILGGEVEITRGFEAQEYWTALDVRAGNGNAAGLIFDSSPYAIRD